MIKAQFGGGAASQKFCQKLVFKKPGPTWTGLFFTQALLTKSAKTYQTQIFEQYHMCMSLEKHVNFNIHMILNRETMDGMAQYEIIMN